MGAWRFEGAISASHAWAKFDGDTGATMSVSRHSADTAAMASWLWDGFFTESVRRQIDAVAGGRGREAYVWLSALHDVGKLSIDFSSLILRRPHGEIVLNRLRAAGLDAMSTVRPGKAFRHELFSHVALRDWIEASFGPFDLTVHLSESLPSVVGSHHGHTPQSELLVAVAQYVHSDEPEMWATARRELIDVVTDELGVRDLVHEWVSVRWPVHVLVLLNAMVIVADWMASDAEAFPFATDDSEDRLAHALSRLQIPPPWSGSAPEGDSAAFVASRFPDLAGEPNAMQRLLVEACRDADSAPLVVLESPTGSGKTEAALSAAEVLAERFGSGGLYIAMPTMASGNAMFDRLVTWVDNLPDPHVQSITLAHSKSGLNERFTRLRYGRAAGVADDDKSGWGTAQAAVVDWFLGRKRTLLASFGVGTIDQLLMAGLTAKHVALRHLAFAGKVVIVDEVHAADAVQRVYLKQVLGWLAAYGVPVLLMSATLPPAQRVELVESYAAGRRRGRRAPKVDIDLQLGTAAYPRITLWDGEVRELESAADPRFARSVRLRTLEPDEDALTRLLSDRLVDGGCVAVIRNTVSRAQETYEYLRRQFGDAVLLMHSRYLSVDRMRAEKDLVSRLGPGCDRPRLLIVVATQVIEQSLDLDFDLMITDLAPADLVVQRMGRLHRHDLPSSARPQSLRVPECWIDEMPSDEVAPVLGKGSSRVYAPTLLIRSAVVLSPLVDAEVHLPSMVPGLVADAYSSTLVPPPAWQGAMADADARFAHKQSATTELVEKGQLITAASQGAASLVGFFSGALADGDEQGISRVRDGEDSFEVIVVRRTVDGLKPLAHTVIGDRLLSTFEPLDPWLAVRLAGHTVTLPSWFGLGEVGATALTGLEGDGIAAWQESPWLRGQLLLVLGPDARREMAGYVLTYDDVVGLTIRRA